MPKHNLCEKDIMATNMETRASKRHHRVSPKQKLQQEQKKKSKASRKRRSSWTPRSPPSCSTESSVSPPPQQVSGTTLQSQQSVSRQPTPDPSFAFCAPAPPQTVDQPCGTLVEKNFEFITKWPDSCEESAEKPQDCHFISAESLFEHLTTMSVEPPPSASQQHDDTFSSTSLSPTVDTKKSASKTVVEEGDYVKRNMCFNGYDLLMGDMDMASDIKNYWDRHIEPKLETGETPTEAQVGEIMVEMRDLALKVQESVVLKAYKAHSLPEPPSRDVLRTRDGQLMPKSSTPAIASAGWKVSTPKPDTMYGYSSEDAFKEAQQTVLSGFKKSLDGIDHRGELVLSFLVAELKGGDGIMRVAANQIMAGIQACVLITERLNTKLQQSMAYLERHKSELPTASHVVSPKTMDEIAFGLVGNERTAEPFVAYKDPQDDRRKVVNLDTYSLRRPDDYKAIHRYMRNILKWGRDHHLGEIRGVLDYIAKVEEFKKNITREKRDRKNGNSVKGHKGRKRKTDS